MSRTTRWLLGTLFLLALSAVGALIGLRFYLTSSQVAVQAAEQLSATLQSPVRVRAADIGLTGGSSLRGVQLFESDEAELPWAQVEEIEADVSALGLAGGAAPTRVTLRGGAVELRFAASGTLLTRPPLLGGKPGGGLPRVLLEDSRLTLRQEGRPAMVLNGINAVAEPAEGGVRLHGTLSDPDWGEWQIEGRLEDAGSMNLHLKTPQATATPKRLRSVPFVPPEVWEQVQAEGETGVDVTLRFRADGKDPHYRVTLDVLAAAVDLTAIGMHADETTGRVVIEDALVSLQNVTGRVSGGKLVVSEGQLDLRQNPTRMTFDLTGRDLDPRKLPKAWQSDDRLAELLQTFEGALRLQGNANLIVTVAENGKVETSGSGEAEVTGVKLAGKEAKITLKIDLDNRVRFSAAPRPLPLLLTVLHAEAPAPRTTPGTVELNLGLQDVDLAQLARELGLDLPLEVAGKLSFQVKAALPVATPRDLKTYQLEGTATLPTLTLAGLRLRSVEARFHYDKGILYLDKIAGSVPEPNGATAGRVSGVAQWGLLVEDGELTADVQLDAAPVAALRPFLPGPAEAAGGSLSGTLEGKVVSSRINDPTAWNLTGHVHSDEAKLYGLRLQHMTTDIQVEDGIARLTKLRGKLEGATLTGAGQLRLQEPYRYKATLEIGETDLAALDRLSPELRPSVETRGKLSGTVTAEGVLGEKPALTGTVATRDLVVEGFTLSAATARWSLGENGLRVTELNANLYDGTLTGSATVPLEKGQAGSAVLDFTDVNAGSLVRSVPELPLTVAGKVSGKLRLELPTGAAKSPDIAADLTLNEGQLRIQNIPTRKLQGTVRYRDGATQYELQGESLGGKFQLDGQLPAPEEKAPPKPNASQGRLRVQRAELAQLWEALRLPALAPLTGRFDLDVPFTATPEGALAGRGRFRLSGVRLSDDALADDLRGDVLLADNTLDFQNVSGRVAGGLARVQVLYNLQEPERSFFTLALDRVESSVLLRPLQGREDYIRGPANVQLRGRLGREWGGRGDVTLLNGEVFGIPVSEWRLPVDLAFTPVQGRGEVIVTESHGEVGRGRVTGRASYRWGGTNRLEGTLRFQRVEVREFLGPSSLFGSGRASGRFDFQANDLRSVNDLAGNLEASLDDAQALRMPVLRELVRYVAPGQGGARFESGDVRGRLASGVFRLQRLALANAYLQLVVEGTVTLAGRLNLEATARTGSLGTIPLPLRLVRFRLPPVGPIPLGIITEVSNYLSNRVVHLQITGTVQSPVIRVDPIRLLTEEAVRYFLTRLVIPIP